MALNLKKKVKSVEVSEEVKAIQAAYKEQHGEDSTLDAAEIQKLFDQAAPDKNGDVDPDDVIAAIRVAEGHEDGDDGSDVDAVPKAIDATKIPQGAIALAEKIGNSPIMVHLQEFAQARIIVDRSPAQLALDVQSLFSAEEIDDMPWPNSRKPDDYKGNVPAKEKYDWTAAGEPTFFSGAFSLTPWGRELHERKLILDLANNEKGGNAPEVVAERKARHPRDTEDELDAINRKIRNALGAFKTAITVVKGMKLFRDELNLDVRLRTTKDKAGKTVLYGNDRSRCVRIQQIGNDELVGYYSASNFARLTRVNGKNGLNNHPEVDRIKVAAGAGEAFGHIQPKRGRKQQEDTTRRAGVVVTNATQAVDATTQLGGAFATDKDGSFYRNWCSSMVTGADRLQNMRDLKSLKATIDKAMERQDFKAVLKELDDVESADQKKVA